MAKGSVRKKGKKWYYRFYVEDESGNRVQKECIGTESKSETEALLRKAMEEYDGIKFVPVAKNLTVGDLLDIWAEEELATGTLSNGTVKDYFQVIKRIKRHPISKRKIKTITSGHLQQFVDLLVFGGQAGDFVSKGYTKDYVHTYMAVLQRSFRFAVFPKNFISINPMQYVIQKKSTEDLDLFEDQDVEDDVKPLTTELYRKLMDYLERRNRPAILPVQIAYYTGLRIGEVCGLMWQDINLDEQYLTVRRSVSYNSMTHRVEIGPTKRKKIRVVDFGDTLAKILRTAREKQKEAEKVYGALYHKNYYLEVREKNRVHYELCSVEAIQGIPRGGHEISLVCLRPDGAYESPSTIGSACRSAKKKVPGLESFHFHVLRHTYTTNLLTNGAAPKDVQELLGHSDLSTTMHYAHATREAKRSSVKLLDRLPDSV